MTLGNRKVFSHAIKFFFLNLFSLCFLYPSKYIKMLFSLWCRHNNSWCEWSVGLMSQDEIWCKKWHIISASFKKQLKSQFFVSLFASFFLHCKRRLWRNDHFKCISCEFLPWVCQHTHTHISHRHVV